MFLPICKICSTFMNFSLLSIDDFMHLFQEEVMHLLHGALQLETTFVETAKPYMSSSETCETPDSKNMRNNSLTDVYMHSYNVVYTLTQYLSMYK